MSREEVIRARRDYVQTQSQLVEYREFEAQQRTRESEVEKLLDTVRQDQAVIDHLILSKHL